jgi:hypothetical protein
MFLAKYDSSGHAIWAKSATGISHGVIGFNVAIDNFSNAYVTGYFTSPVAYFDSDSLVNPGHEAFFITKYDSGGNVLWAKGSICARDCEGRGNATDGFGNIYCTGVFDSATVTFGSYTLTNIDTGRFNFFIVKYNSNGDVLWCKNANGDAIGYRVATDRCGNAYVTGQCYNNVPLTFDTITLQPPVILGDPMYLVKYDPTGQAQFGFVLGSGGDDNNGVAAGNSGSIYITGDFAINPFIVGNDTLALVGEETSFTAKLSNHVSCKETNLNDVPALSGILIFPNPFTNFITLNFPFPQSTKALLKIFNSIGESVVEKEIQLEDQTLDLTSFPTGIYMVMVRNEKWTWNGKIVK